MESTKSVVSSSVAEYLEKDKLCQEICETITKSVEGPLVQNSCSFPQEASSLLPELNSDEDVEDILQQISDLLGSQLGDSSQCTEIDGADDLSVDEILRKAEQIVNASTPYFERKTYSDAGTGIETLLKPITRGVKKLAGPISVVPRAASSSKSKSERESPTIGNSVNSDENDELNSDEDDDEFESPRPETPVNGSPSLRKSRSDTLCHLKLSQSVQKSLSTGAFHFSTNQEPGCQVVASVQNQQTEEKRCEVGSKDLSLSDLQDVVEEILPDAAGSGSVTVEHVELESTVNPHEIIEQKETALEQQSHECHPLLKEPSLTLKSTESKFETVAQAQDTGAEIERSELTASKFGGITKNAVIPKDRSIQSTVGDAFEPQIESYAKNARAEQRTIKSVKTQPSKLQPKRCKVEDEEFCSNEDHCSTILNLRTTIKSLSTKISELEKVEERARKTDTLAAAERQRIKILQEEVRSQEDLILGYQQENHRLTNDIMSAKESWKATEVQLVDKIVELEKRLSLNTANSTKEKDELNKHLKQAYDLVKKLEFELNRLKNEKAELKKDNDELTVDVMRLNCELEEHKKEYDSWATNENDKLALMESNALIQSKLSQVNTEVTKKQTEIIRLNGEIGRLRGELEKIRLGSVINHTVDSTHAVSQLQAALAMERDNSNEIAKERDCLNNEVRDLRKQVALLDNGEYGERAENANKPGTALSQRQMTAELEATRYKIELDQSRDKYVVLQNKYDRDIVELGQQIKKLQKENLSLKHLLNDQAKHQPRKTLANSKMKEDAHLLATIRGLQGELNTREKEVHRLNKELMDARKTNRRLQQEREKALNSSSSKMRGSQYGKESDALGVSRPNSGCSAQSAKDYNPLAFEDNQEAVLFLRNENRTLLEEIKRLEQDLISLHNKRIQDMSDLQEQHDREMSSMRRDHASKHSSSTVAHLQGQLYTQQMVIHHLKQQIKEYEERFEENSILKAERDHFERALMKAKQKIARLSELASPENVQYAGLLEKLEYLERRHEIREEKLQSIVRDLIAKQKKGTCSENCRDKILNKNREICYYRAEMDKILATLAEFRWN